MIFIIIIIIITTLIKNNIQHHQKVLPSEGFIRISSNLKKNIFFQDN